MPPRSAVLQFVLDLDANLGNLVIGPLGDVMDRLIEGYRQFRQRYFDKNRELFDQLALGQSPKVMLVSCCDSRVDPGLIFNSPPGEIFTVRNIANLVPPYSPDDCCHGTSAAIEFATRALQVEHIIVLGHAGCGGVLALLRSHSDGEFIGPWMRIAAPATSRVCAANPGLAEEDLRRLCEHEVVKVSLGNLRSFPWVAERMAAGTLALHGWYFDIEKGELHALDKDRAVFNQIV